MASAELATTPVRPSYSRANSGDSHNSSLTRRARIRSQSRAADDSPWSDSTGAQHSRVDITIRRPRAMVGDNLASDSFDRPTRIQRSPRPAGLHISEPGDVEMAPPSPRGRKSSGGAASAGSSRSALSSRGAQATLQLQELIDLKNAIAGKRGALSSRSQAVPSAYRPPLYKIDTANPRAGGTRTRASSAASSIYPQSTHTASPSESSVSPHSIGTQPSEKVTDPFEPVYDDLDRDDVSYRLRLLVKNSYYLPPAHSKPMSADLTSPYKHHKKLSSRGSGAPTFLDLFRLGKSKSRPETPSSSSTTAAETYAPMVRKPSDTNASGTNTRSQNRTLLRSRSQPFNHTASKDPTGRVVVVREVVDDLAIAAKEAEHGMKIQEWRNSQLVQEAPADVIDPTDAVDMPLMSSYPFAVQSTITHGLGVQESIGAADLAEKLPPPDTTATWSSLRSPDNAWRRNLLHEAVGHSLSNSPSLQSLKNGGANTPKSGKPHTLSTRPSKLKLALDQRIISQPVIEDNESPSNNVTFSAPGHDNAVSPINRHFRRLSNPDSSEAVRRSSYVPRRAETPSSSPHTPLAPPPRNVFTNQTSSSTDLALNTEGGQTILTPPPWISIRKAKSSPVLIAGPADPIPLVPLVNDSVPMRSSHVVQDSFSSCSSHCADDQEDGSSFHRPSMAFSAESIEESYRDEDLSPSMSAFQDAMEEVDFIPGSISAWTKEHTSPPHTPRYSTMSPPPRPSTSIANTGLQPPPRSSSLHYKMVTTRATPSPSPTASSHSRASYVPPILPDPQVVLEQPSSPGFHTPVSLPGASLILPAPVPTTPLSSRRGTIGPKPLLLNIAAARVPVAIHSAPPPASPASFFDNIHDGMHDLESDDDSSEDEDVEGAVESVHNGSEDDGDRDGDRDLLDSTLRHEPRPRATSSNELPPLTPPRASFSFSQHANRSTPNVAHSTFSPTLASFSPTLARFATSHKKTISHKPISNVPARYSFFSSKKGGKSPKKSPLEFVMSPEVDQATLPPMPKLSLGEEASSSRGHGGKADSVNDWQKNQSSQDESLRKLDGLVLQHMEAEKDRIRQIAKSLHESSEGKSSS